MDRSSAIVVILAADTRPQSAFSSFQCTQRLQLHLQHPATHRARSKKSSTALPCLSRHWLLTLRIPRETGSAALPSRTKQPDDLCLHTTFNRCAGRYAGTLFVLLLPDQTAVHNIAFLCRLHVSLRMKLHSTPLVLTGTYLSAWSGPICMYIDADFHIHNAAKRLTEIVATTEVVQADLSPWPFTTPHPP